jgi:hypothetical protein
VSPYYVAYHREEGRLDALTGDTAGRSSPTAATSRSGRRGARFQPRCGRSGVPWRCLRAVAKR